MVDYNAALPQLAQFQAPNVLALAQQANQMQLHRAQLAEVQRAAQEQNQLRSLLESGVDRNSPDFLKQVYRISPTMGMTLEKGQAELQNATLTRKKTEGELAEQPVKLQTAKAEAAAKTLAFHRETAPIVKDQATYDIWRANLLKDAPQLEAQVDKIYSPEGMQRLITTHDASMKEYAAQAAEQRLQARPQIQTIKNADGSESLVRVAPGVGASTPIPGAQGAAKPLEAWTDTTTGRRYQPERNAAGEIIGQREITPGAVTQPFAPPANAPAAVMRQPTTAAAAPAVGDSYAQRNAQIEGTAKNPMSSAQGLHQFIDSTFVGTAKKVFPELANKSPAEILALRGTQLADGTPIESALEQRFRADNIASLASAGIQPTPGNTYLAHFLGAGGARSVLGADPNTPVASLLDPRAIAANKSVLEGKTAGEVAAWAASKFSGQPGLSASMTASNARLGGAPTGFVPANNALMSLGAPTVNNALMANMFGAAPSQNAGLSLQPQIPGALTPPTAQMPTAAAVAPPAPAVAPSATANMSPAARAEYDKKMADAAAAQETAKANKKEVGEYILRTIGGEGGKKIEDLISASTSGRVQKWGAETVGAFGTATPGMENIGKLGTIAKQMTFDLLNGKLGAGISNDDRTFIAGLVADIANPDVPANERIAGFRQLKNTMSAWASGKEVEIGAPAVAPESGVPRGRRGALNAATPPKASSSSAKAPAGVPQNVWDVMTPEERALF